jgi:hypothetical protein
VSSVVGSVAVGSVEVGTVADAATVNEDSGANTVNVLVLGIRR